MKKDIYEKFFELLRFSVGASDEFEKLTITDEDWWGIHGICIQQTVIGVCFVGISRLPDELRPPKELLFRWYADINELKRLNHIINYRAASACRRIDKLGYKACILKGQGNALMYPEMMQRTPGDIDLWMVVCGDNGELRIDDDAILAFSRKYLGNTHYCYHHVDGSNMNGTPVEIHYRPAFMNNLIHNKRLQQYFKEQTPFQFSHAEHISEEGRFIIVPTLDFNITYQMVHLSNHFFNEGMGLRQVIDYYYLLKKSFETGRKEDTTRLFRHLGIYKFATAVMWVLHEVLAMPEEWMIVAANEKQGRFLLEEIMQSGNFGKYDSRVSDKMRDSGLGRNIQRVKRDLRLMGMFPSECMWEPVFRVWHWLWRVNHRPKS